MLSPKATERIITEAVEAVKDWQALRVKPEICLLYTSFGYRNFSSRDRNGFVQKDSFLKPSKGQHALCFYVYDAWSPICRFSFLAQERPARECIILS